MDLTQQASAFWTTLKNEWGVIQDTLLNGKQEDRHRILQLLSWFAGPLSEFVDFEITIGELNRTEYTSAKSIIELYISPKLLLANVPKMQALIDGNLNLDRLHVVKYRSYNSKDPLIATVTYEDHTFDYTDFGCQHFSGLSENKEPIINLVMYVKKAAAEKLLQKKQMTFILADKSEQVAMKWLPTKTNVIDILLVNVIGEYNLIHRTGYIEFLPEGDPLIAPGSVFTELSDLRAAYNALDRMTGVVSCQVCDRKLYQAGLLACAGCKKSKYCCRVCQSIDYKQHKKFCKLAN